MGLFAIVRTAHGYLSKHQDSGSRCHLELRPACSRVTWPTAYVLNTERTAQTTVTTSSTRSPSLSTAISVVKYFFQPKADEVLSYSQITGVSQTALRSLPPGTDAALHPCL